MTEVFSQPDDLGDARASEATTSLAGQIGARSADTLDPKNYASGMWLVRRAREAAAGGLLDAPGAGGDIDIFSGASLEDQQAVVDRKRAAIPDISRDDARLLLKQEGLGEADVHLGDAESHKLPVLRLRIGEAQERRDREAAIDRGPQGFFPSALGFITSLGVGMIDPVNAAAFSIPVIGEARMGKILASAGDSILARGGMRAGEGAAKGAAGTAALQPADWWLHTQDGKDYTMAEAMESVIMGAGMGSAFHAAPGAFRDWSARRRGVPLQGSTSEQLLQALHPLEARVAGAAGEEMPGASAEAADRLAPIHPALVLADLPPGVREDAVHAAMADIIADRPVRAAQLLDIAADHDPRIAEAVSPWNEAGEEARSPGRTDQGARDAEGAHAPGAVRGDRSAHAAAAADPRWRELADARRDYNEPETLSESEAASRVPEPDSLVPERSLSALETAAADAEEVWRKVEPTLTEQERAVVNDAMAALKDDAETRSQIISDGAACLAAAMAA